MDSLPDTPQSLDEILLAHQVIAPEGLERARRAQAQRDLPLDTVIAELGLATEQAIAAAIASALNLPLASIEDFPHGKPPGEDISLSFLRRKRVYPLADHGAAVTVAAVNPLDQETLASLAYVFGKAIEPIVARPSDLNAVLDRLVLGFTESREQGTPVDEGQVSEDDIERLKDRASDAPVTRLVDRLIANAVDAGASDIHVEPLENRLRIRYRVDGALQEVESRPPGDRAAIVSRIKIMAGLDIAERRLAQDGRMRVPVRGKAIDLRVATLPSMFGESAVLRILDRGNLPLDFEALGFEADLLANYRKLIDRPNGIVLVTGPTGSGKTTTLYTSLRELNTLDRKILTVEDPIEYQLDGINQHQVRPHIDFTFANALRAFLRHDPDIMMVGEIRDRETAQIAVQAALTGHLILSTLHTNDAASAITRLLDMGIEDYLLASTVHGLVGQRLVRTLCGSCKEAYRPATALMDRLELHKHVETSAAPTLWRAVGCARCRGTGFAGRTMIVEVLRVTDAIRALVMRRAEAREIQRRGIEEGMITLHGHGLRKALAGLTTVEEVLRATVAG